jgi:DNA-binding XRE family transcriptional regulator
MTNLKQHFVVKRKRKKMLALARGMPTIGPMVDTSKNTTAKPRWAMRLERAREAAGYRHAVDFARHMGLSQQRYAHYEAGKREPDYALLVEMCQALKVTPNYILTGADGISGQQAA